MIVIKDMGVPRLGNTQRRGDQVVHLNVQTPTKLNAEERRLLEKLAELRGESLKVAHNTFTQSSRIPDSSVNRQERTKDVTTDSAVPGEKAPSNGGDSAKSESDSQGKDDPSFFERIVEVFKPKNGEHGDK
jgi:DnaJ-class molecular chaperone